MPQYQYIIYNNNMIPRKDHWLSVRPSTCVIKSIWPGAKLGVGFAVWEQKLPSSDLNCRSSSLRSDSSRPLYLQLKGPFQAICTHQYMVPQLGSQCKVVAYEVSFFAFLYLSTLADTLCLIFSG